MTVASLSAYPPLLSLPTERRALRQRLTREIRRMVAPYLRDSGYNKHLDRKKGMFGPKRPYRLWAPAGDKTIRFRGAYVLTEMVGIGEDGPITDWTGGGMIWTGYAALPIEDLLKLHDWARFKLPELVKKALAA